MNMVYSMNKLNQSTTMVPLNKVLKSQMLTQGPTISWQLIQECTLHLTQTILKKISIKMKNLLCQGLFFSLKNSYSQIKAR